MILSEKAFSIKEMIKDWRTEIKKEAVADVRECFKQKKQKLIEGTPVGRGSLCCRHDGETPSRCRRGSGHEPKHVARQRPRESSAGRRRGLALLSSDLRGTGTIFKNNNNKKLRRGA